MLHQATHRFWTVLGSSCAHHRSLRHWDAPLRQQGRRLRIRASNSAILIAFLLPSTTEVLLAQQECPSGLFRAVPNAALLVKGPGVPIVGPTLFRLAREIGIRVNRTITLYYPRKVQNPTTNSVLPSIERDPCACAVVYHPIAALLNPWTCRTFRAIYLLSISLLTSLQWYRRSTILSQQSTILGTYKTTCKTTYYRL